MSFITLNSEHASRRQHLNINGLVVSRIAGLPIQAVPVSSSKTAGLLCEWRKLDSLLLLMKQPLLDSIFNLIPKLSISNRRILLAAKRKIFQGAEVEIPLVKDIPQSLIDSCLLWNERISRVSSIKMKLSNICLAEMHEATEAFSQLFKDSNLLSSIAIASPSFVIELNRKESSFADWNMRMLRTAYMYVTRSAFKTSPFSGLTTVGVAGRQGLGRHYCCLALHVSHGILKDGLQKCRQEGYEDLDLRIVPSPFSLITADEHVALAMIPEFHYRDGIIHREEIVVGGAHIPEEFRLLVDTCGEGVTFDEAVSKVEALKPEIRVQRYLDVGLLRAVTPWRRGEDPIPALRESFADGTAHISTDELRWIASVPERVCSADANNRSLILKDLRLLVDKCFYNNELGDHPSGLVYEDCEYEGFLRHPFEFPTVRDDIEQLANLCEPWIVRSRAYDLMVNRFVERYGSGGECTDVLGFLMSLSVDNDGDTDFFNAMSQDMSAAEPTAERQSLAGGISAAPRNIGALIQVVGDSEEDILAGRGLTVVNAFGAGNGAAQARFHHLLGEGFRLELSDNVHKMWQTRRVYEIAFWTEMNTGQEMCTGLLPPIVLPGEPPARNGLPLTALRLMHDKDNDTLYLCDDKEPIGIAYLGLTPQYILDGYFRWLALLADPWLRLTPYSDHWSSQFPKTGFSLNEDIVKIPRIQKNRLVTRRASWYLPGSMALSLFKTDNVDTLRSWNDFRIRHEIPREVFVYQITQSVGSTADSRKPLYADLSSAVSLMVLGKWLGKGTGHIRIVEALPNCDQHPFRDSNGQRRACEESVTMYWRDGNSYGSH